MKKSGKILTVSALSLLALSACGGDGSSPSLLPGGGVNFGDMGSGGPQGDNSPGFQCPIVYDSAAVAQAQAQGPSASFGYRISVESSLVTCTETHTVNGSSTTTTRNGYQQITVFPKIRATGAARILPSDSSDMETLEVPVEVQTLSDDVKRTLARRLGATASSDADLAASVAEGRSEPTLALVAGLPVLTVDLAAAGPGDGARYVARIAFDSRYDAEVSAFLPALDNGTTPITLLQSGALLEQFPDFLSFAVRRINVFDAESGLSSAALAAEEWTRSKDRGPRERLIALEYASDWLEDKPSAGGEAASALQDALSYARAFWSPKPAPSDITDASGEDLLARVKLIAAADPGDQAAPYGRMAARVYDGMRGTAAATIREAISLVDDHPFNDAQLDAISRTATALTGAGGNLITAGSMPWLDAKVLTVAEGFDEVKIAVTISAASWLSTNLLASPMDTAKDLVLNRGLTADRLEILEPTYEWLSGYSGPHQLSAGALARAESYVLDRSETQDQLEMLEESFEWLASYSGPHVATAAAMTVMERWVFAKHIDSTKLERLKDAYGRLAQSMPSGEALAEAERETL